MHHDDEAGEGDLLAFLRASPLHFFLQQPDSGMKKNLKLQESTEIKIKIHYILGKMQPVLLQRQSRHHVLPRIRHQARTTPHHRSPNENAMPHH